MANKRKIVKLKSSDDEIIEVDEAVALESVTIRNIIEDARMDNPIISIPNVTANILSKVVHYLNYHVEAAKPTVQGNAALHSEEDVRKWDEEFVKVDIPTLLDLIQAANYLEIKKLLNLTCQTVADMITGKSPEEIRKTFNITNDFTAEEEAEIRRQNQWAFHD